MQKAPLAVSKTDFPEGVKLPEGVACDLARAFIQHNEKLLTATCLLATTYNGSPAQKEYRAFLKKVQQQLLQEAKSPKPSPTTPKAILKVYAARPLSQSGPASYGFATFSFKEVKFVDVEVLLHSGKKALQRTLVVQLADLSWRVHPLPALSPLLSSGLNQEKPSQVVYQSKK